MPHARQQIREAVATALVGLPTTGSNVYQSRMRPATDDTLPCLLVMTGDEAIDSTAQEWQTRRLVVLVQGMAKATADVDDTLDDIALEVEEALFNAGTLGGKLPGGLVLQKMEMDFNDSLDKPIGVIALQFSADYFTNAGTPGVLL